MRIYRKSILLLVLLVFAMPNMVAAANLTYEVIEDVFDSSSQIRTVIEQASVGGGKGWLIRTTIYTPVSVDTNVTFVPISSTKVKLFDPIQ